MSDKGKIRANLRYIGRHKPKIVEEADCCAEARRELARELLEKHDERNRRNLSPGNHAPEHPYAGLLADLQEIAEEGDQ